MIIEEHDFKLTPATNTASPFWDLEVLVTIKGKNPRQEFKNIGYGMTLESAIRHIANYRVLHNRKDEAISLKQYLIDYKNELRNLYTAVNN